MTFTVHTPSQFAFAEFVRRDPSRDRLAPFYQQKRDLFLQLIDGSRFKPLPCEGTYFQLLDYSAIATDKDKDMAMRLIKEHGVASIPVLGVSLQGRRRTGAALLFRQEGRDAARGRRSAADMTSRIRGSASHEIRICRR